MSTKPYPLSAISTQILDHRPGQPVLIPHHSFREVFSKIQAEPPLVQLEATTSYVVTVTWERRQL